MFQKKGMYIVAPGTVVSGSFCPLAPGRNTLAHPNGWAVQLSLILTTCMAPSDTWPWGAWMKTLVVRQVTAVMDMSPCTWGVMALALAILVTFIFAVLRLGLPIHPPGCDLDKRMYYVLFTILPL